MEVNSGRTAEAIKAFGPTCVAYKRGPVTGASFIISTLPGGRGLIVFSTDNAEVSIHGSRKHKQVLLKVNEEERDVSITRIASHSLFHNLRYDLTRRGDQQAIKRRVIEIFGPVVDSPLASMTTCELLVDPEVAQRHLRNRVDIPFRLTTHLRASKVNLLAGIDETAHFVCAVPGRPSSVEEAHAALRPMLRKGKAVRQGEFFFEKVEDKKMINRLLLSTSGPGVFYNEPLEDGSSHSAAIRIVLNRRVYVYGAIVDRRKGRHAPLLLSEWHKVVRNKEIRMPVSHRTNRWD